MTWIDTLLIHIYLLAIFATAIKPKVPLSLYRTLKWLATLFCVYIIVALIWRLHPVDWSFIFILRVLPLPLIVYVLLRTEVADLMRSLGFRSGRKLANTIEAKVKLGLLESVERLSARKIGALITFERGDALDEFVNPAFTVDAPLGADLLLTIFMPNTPMHDGAVIIRRNRIVSAGSYFPHTDVSDIPKQLGSRHRAAIGISEITDAFTVVVSEETGNISVAVDGTLDRDISQESLILYIERYLEH